MTDDLGSRICRYICITGNKKHLWENGRIGWTSAVPHETGLTSHACYSWSPTDRLPSPFPTPSHPRAPPIPPPTPRTTCQRHREPTIACYSGALPTCLIPFSTWKVIKPSSNFTLDTPVLTLSALNLAHTEQNMIHDDLCTTRCRSLVCVPREGRHFAFVISKSQAATCPW